MTPTPESSSPATVEVTKRRFSIGIFVLALFLTLLLVTIGESALQDFEQIPPRPGLEEYEKKFQDKALESEKETAAKVVSRAQARVTQIASQQQLSEDQYLTAKDIVDTLLQVKNARAAAGEKLTPPENKELAAAQGRYLSAKKQYQVLLHVRREAQKTVEQAQDAQSRIEKQVTDKMQQAHQEYDAAMLHYRLLVTLLRILFVVPVVLIALYLYARKRESRYAALVWAYLLAAAYIFMRAAYEYIPTFHWYGIRLFGVAILVILIVMTVRYFHRTSDERLLAEIKAHLLKKLCPNCKYPFIDSQSRYLVNGLGRLRGMKIGGPVEVVEPTRGSVFCRSCGLSIVDQCGGCREFKYALLPYCPRCRACTSLAERVAAK